MKRKAKEKIEAQTTSECFLEDKQLSGSFSSAPLSSRIEDGDESRPSRNSYDGHVHPSSLICLQEGVLTRPSKAARTEVGYSLEGDEPGPVITSEVNGQAEAAQASKLLYSNSDDSKRFKRPSSVASTPSNRSNGKSSPRLMKNRHGKGSPDGNKPTPTHNQRERERSRRISEHIQELGEIIQQIGIKKCHSNKQSTLETAKALLRDNIEKLSCWDHCGEESTVTSFPTRKVSPWGQLMEDAEALGCTTDLHGNIYNMTKALDALLRSCFQLPTEHVMHSLFSIMSLQCHEVLFRMLQQVPTLPRYGNGAACMILRMRPELGVYGLANVWVCVQNVSPRREAQREDCKLVWLVPANHCAQGSAFGNVGSTPALPLPTSMSPQHSTLVRSLGGDAAEFLKRIAKKIASKSGTREARSFGKQMMAKLATGVYADDAAKFLKRIAKKISASKSGTREARSFRKQMMAKLAVTLMQGNIRMLDSLGPASLP